MIRSCPRMPLRQDLGRIYQQLIRMFSAVLALVVILVETEWEKFLALVRVFEYWVVRGLLQVNNSSCLFSQSFPHHGATISCRPPLRRGCSSPPCEQVFLALLTLELATAGGDSDFSKSVRLYRMVSGFSMLACGMFYIMGGCCCFAALKKARHRRIVERMKAQADLLMIEKQVRAWAWRVFASSGMLRAGTGGGQPTECAAKGGR